MPVPGPLGASRSAVAAAWENRAVASDPAFEKVPVTRSYTSAVATAFPAKPSSVLDRRGWTGGYLSGRVGATLEPTLPHDGQKQQRPDLSLPSHTCPCRCRCWRQSDRTSGMGLRLARRLRDGSQSL